jgi:hypothetical protein
MTRFEFTLISFLLFLILGFVIQILFNQVYGLELNKDCVNFSDGKTAIVFTEGGITDDFKFIWCDGSDVAWFISKGYHIDSEQSSWGPIDKVYLTR